MKSTSFRVKIKEKTKTIMHVQKLANFFTVKPVYSEACPGIWQENEYENN